MNQERADRLKGQRETRRITVPASSLQIRATADGGLEFDGYALSWDQPYEVQDWYGTYTETIVRGAATKTLQEKADVRFLVNHDGVPMGRTKSGTLTLLADDQGLRTQCTLDASNPTVQEVQSAMKRGDLDEMSFAFMAIRQEWNEDYTDRKVLELKLFDVSVVTYPASPFTSAALRGADLIRALAASDPEELLVAARSSGATGMLTTLHERLGAALGRSAPAGAKSARASDDDSTTLAQAVDAAIDEALNVIDDNPAQAKDVLTAAASSVDDLLEALGGTDADDPAPEPEENSGVPLDILRRQLDLLAIAR